MNKAEVLSFLVAVMLVAIAVVAEAQQPGKIPRIGILNPDSEPGVCPDGFLEGMRELGYVDGKNFVVEAPLRRGVEAERYREVAADLVRSAPM